MFLALLLTPPAAALALLAAFLALEVVGAFARHRPTPFDRPSPIAVVIPAHDEGAGLRATVEEAKAQLAPGDRLVVIADNCSDDTADAARAAGAEVLERTDPDRRGKGFALQFALDALRAAPPDVVYFIDADCIPEAGAIEKVAAAAHASGRPAQGLTLMTAPEGAPPHRKVAEFAWLMMNRIRMAGLFRWFDVTRLTGTGMALPWRIATDLDLASGEIVEDLALSLALTRAGTPPVFAPDAVIRGTFPAS
ncbi:MAG: glycosyltransferase family 2 protein, partial [Pseudomonadota bacterium]